MKKIRDKEFLTKLSKEVHAELDFRHLGAPFRLKTKLKPQSTETDGWSVAIGTISGYQCSAEIWLDRFTAHPTRKVYYGLYSKNSNGLVKLVKAARREFGKHLLIFQKDLAQNSDDCQLAKQLAKTRFGHPIYEKYPHSKEFLYGIYEYDTTGLQRNVFKRLVERSSDFFQTVIESIAEINPRSDYQIYQAAENRQAVTRHIRRERNSHAATLRKQSDNYICQVCKFNFSKIYAPIGDDFAEAHHIVPLSSNKKLRSTTIDDLITVCANCHRMLHRLRGESNDIDYLKKIVQAGKKR